MFRSRMAFGGQLGISCHRVGHFDGLDAHRRTDFHPACAVLITGCQRMRYRRRKHRQQHRATGDPGSESMYFLVDEHAAHHSTCVLDTELSAMSKRHQADDHENGRTLSPMITLPRDGNNDDLLFKLLFFLPLDQAYLPNARCSIRHSVHDRPTQVESKPGWFLKADARWDTQSRANLL